MKCTFCDKEAFAEIPDYPDKERYICKDHVDELIKEIQSNKITVIWRN